MNPLERIQSYYGELTKTDLDIANVILNDPREAARGNIDHLAKLSHVSKSAVVRFANRIGYSGYTDLKYDLSRFLTSRNAGPETETRDSVKAITDIYSRYIEQIPECVTSQDLRQIATRLIKAGRIKIFGQNRTFNSAMQLRTRLAKIGIDAEAISDTSLMTDISINLSEQDCLILFTIQDNTGWYRRILNSMKENHCQILCFTMSQTLAFRRRCEEYIVLPRISRDSAVSFLDDQAIYFVFIELLMDAIASALQEGK